MACFCVCSRSIVEVVDDAAGGACNDNCIHGMMAMVDALFTESFGEDDRDVDLEIALTLFAYPLAIVCGVSNGIHALKAWSYDVVPNIIQAPVFL